MKLTIQMKKCVFGMLLHLVCLCPTAIGAISPVSLSCEYSANPLGIDVNIPRLGWQNESTARQQKQTAYEIIVSDNPEEIKGMHGSIWSSGKIASSASVNVIYRGALLKSFTRYY